MTKCMLWQIQLALHTKLQYDIPLLLHCTAQMLFRIFITACEANGRMIVNRMTLHQITSLKCESKTIIQRSVMQKTSICMDDSDHQCPIRVRFAYWLINTQTHTKTWPLVTVLSQCCFSIGQAIMQPFGDFFDINFFHSFIHMVRS